MNTSKTINTPALVSILITLAIIGSAIVSLLPSQNQTQTNNLETQTAAATTITPLPVEAVTLLSTGERALEEQDYQSAVAAYSDVIELIPDYPVAYSQRSLAYKALGFYAKAQVDISIPILHVLSENYTSAVDDYTRAINT